MMEPIPEHVKFQRSEIQTHTASLLHFMLPCTVVGESPVNTYKQYLFIVPDSVDGYSLFVSFVCLFVCLCVCVCVCLSHLFLSHALTQKLLLWSVTQVWPTTEAY